MTQTIDRVGAEPAAVARAGSRARILVSVVVYAVLLGGNFGLPIVGEFSLGPEYIAFYALLLTWGAGRCLRIDRANLLLLGLFVWAILIQAVGGTALTSPTSVLLLLSIYLPLLVRYDGADRLALLAHARSAYSNAAVVLAGLAVVQFLSQFVVRLDWLFDIRALVPAPIAASGYWNQAILVGSVFKANGVFQREPSLLSVAISLAVVVELFDLRARAWRIALFAAAMLASLSGSGIVVLVVALLAPSGLSSLTKMALSLTLLCASYVLADQLGLTFFTERLDEFTTPGSSAYARFVAPVEIIERAAGTSIANLLLGNGAGSISQAIAEYPAKYEVHDPTWAKLIYEYGLLGSAAFVALIVRSLVKSPASFELKIALFYAWTFSGSQILSTQFSTTLYLLCILWR